MKYGDEFVKKVADSVISGSCSIREVKRIFGVSREVLPYFGVVSRSKNQLKYQQNTASNPKQF